MQYLFDKFEPQVHQPGFDKSKLESLIDASVLARSTWDRNTDGEIPDLISESHGNETKDLGGMDKYEVDVLW